MKRILWKYLDAGAAGGAGGAGGEDKKEIKTSADLLKELNQIRGDLEAKSKADATEVVKEQLKEVNTKIEAVKGLPADVSPEDLVKMKGDLEVTIKAFDKLQVMLKGTGTRLEGSGQKSFNDHLIETVKENLEAIKKHKGGEQTFVMKAAGDMSIAANFPNSGPWTQDVRNNLIVNPYDRVWLDDIFPNGNTTGNVVLFPKENGGDGGAGLWTDKTQDKPQMDFDLDSQSSWVKWIAGTLIIDRDMLDDITWLESYLRAKMLLSLKIARNAFILNGSSDTKPVQGLLDAATAYSATPGLADNPVNRILDAAYGQISTDTNDFYAASHALLHNRDAVKLGLNQASGSGEYDLPAGSVGFVNGRLNIGGLDILKTTQVDQNNFLTFDRMAAMFIRRMAPELRVFEDSALAKKNKIMLRIEERVTLAIFNDNAIVKGTLSA